MKRFGFCLLLSIGIAAAPLTAEDTGPLQFNTIVVKHFTNGDAMSLSQDFINDFCDSVRAELQKERAAGQVVEEGTAVTGEAAANSLVIEGKFTHLVEHNAISLGKLTMEIDLYRLSDNALVKAITVRADVYTSPQKNAMKSANFIGASAVSSGIRPALKDISLSGIPPARAGTNVAASGDLAAPSPGAVQAAAPVFASIQFSSNPTGAEITIDGNYAGNTPSLIKLRPGTHSIRITKKGYTPWERSIDTGAGESRTVPAALEKSGQ